VLRDRKAHVPSAQVNRVKAIKVMFSGRFAKSSLPPIRRGTWWSIRRPLLGTMPGRWRKCAGSRSTIPWAPRRASRWRLLLWTGVRRSDVVRIGRQHVRDGWLKFTQQKNRNRKPVRTEIPILPELQQVIDASPAGSMTFLVTGAGAPYTVWGFGNWFRDRCVEAAVPGRTHGLRKAGAATAAENGATTKQLMAIFGWLSVEEAERYTQAAERKRMAGDAMGLLVERRPP
jgi:integrase